MCKKIDVKPVKFATGQIWFVHEDTEITEHLRKEGSTVINGSRPYVIIGVNPTLEIVTCCPLTSNTTTLYKDENDIVFSNPKQVSDYYESRICISQITTKSFNNFTKYMYSISTESMNEVKNSICNYLGIDILPKVETKVVNKEKSVVKESKKADKETDDKIEVPDPNNRKKYDIRDFPLITKDDAIKFLDIFGEMNCKKASELLGVSCQTLYNRRYKARKLLGTS